MALLLCLPPLLVMLPLPPLRPIRWPLSEGAVAVEEPAVVVEAAAAVEVEVEAEAPEEGLHRPGTVRNDDDDDAVEPDEGAAAATCAVDAFPVDAASVEVGDARISALAAPSNADTDAASLDDNDDDDAPADCCCCCISSICAAAFLSFLFAFPLLPVGEATAAAAADPTLELSPAAPEAGAELAAPSKDDAPTVERRAEDAVAAAPAPSEGCCCCCCLRERAPPKPLSVLPAATAGEGVVLPLLLPPDTSPPLCFLSAGAGAGALDGAPSALPAATVALAPVVAPPPPLLGFVELG